MSSRKLDAQLREAALRGDAEKARRLVLEGASDLILPERRVFGWSAEGVDFAHKLAQRAGHEETACAIIDAGCERSRREDAERRKEERGRCIRAPELLAGIAQPESDLVVATASYKAPDCERIFVWRRDGGERIRKLREAWILHDDFPEVEQGLPGATWGQCDAMARGSPRWVWARQGQKLHIWQRGKSAAKADREEIALRGWLPRRLAVAEIARVRVSLAPGWTRYQVELVTERGQPLRLAARRNFGPIVDVTYDISMLWMDAGWAQDLGLALSSATGLPLMLPEELQSSHEGPDDSD